MKGKVRLENICQLIKQQSSNIFCVTATIVVFGLLNQNETIDGFAAFTNSEHFSIISVSSLFGGFLFTGLGIIISGLGTERIRRLDRFGYMNKFYTTIYLAITFNIVTIISAVFLISLKMSDVIVDALVIIEQIFLYLSIIFFVKCMLDLKKIVKMIRDE